MKKLIRLTPFLFSLLLITGCIKNHSQASDGTIEALETLQQSYNELRAEYDIVRKENKVLKKEKSELLDDKVTLLIDKKSLLKENVQLLRDKRDLMLENLALGRELLKYIKLENNSKNNQYYKPEYENGVKYGQHSTGGRTTKTN